MAAGGEIGVEGGDRLVDGGRDRGVAPPSDPAARWPRKGRPGPRVVARSAAARTAQVVQASVSRRRRWRSRASFISG